MVDYTVIIPVYNEKFYIEKCLDSILNSHKEMSYELLLVDGGSDDGTLEILKNYQNKYTGIVNVLYNDKKIAPVGMNIGLSNAKGKFIFIISAHASYPENYFKDLINVCKKTGADCAGPLLITKIKNKNHVSTAIANVLSDKIGTGSTFRSGANRAMEVDTVPFGCYRSKVFKKIGPYNEKLIRNQDIELNKRLKNAGGKIILTPNVQCTYYARENYQELAKNNFENGKWNMLTAYYTGTLKSLSLRHYIPLIFLLILFFSLLCCYKITLGVFLLYLAVIFTRSRSIKGETTIFHQMAAFLVLHFSYGAGELIGLLKIFELIFKK